MAFPSSKKPDMTLILGLGPKKPKPSAPPAFGGEEKAAVAEPEPDGDESSGGIPPEAVCYRDAMQKCATCAYMGKDGMCSKLQIQVEPEASCNLYSGSEQGASDMEAPAEQSMEEVTA